MMNSTPKKRTILFFDSNQKPSGKALIVILLLCATVTFAFIKPLIYGLSQPESIGAYINGNLPSQLTPELSIDVAIPGDFDKIMSIVTEPRTTNMYLTDRFGKIFVVDKNSPNTSSVFLDISPKIWTQNGEIYGSTETGIFIMTFHPEFNVPGSPNRNYFYIYYVGKKNGNKATVYLSRFTRPDGSTTADPNSELVLIEQYVDKPWHRGGGLLFGNDGFLYLAVGDFNSNHWTQRIDERFIGGILRIDVDMDPTRSHPIVKTLQSVDGQSFSGNYYVPNDNPWLDPTGGHFEEYYAIGCRNPHRMTLDSLTGDIYIGNVGSGGNTAIEEINKLEKAANFGWPFREGDQPWEGNVPPSPLIGNITDPVYFYDHTGADYCVIGGQVYRGTTFPNLYGKYIFGDYGSSKIYALDLTGSGPDMIEELASFPPSRPTAISLGPDNEIYIANTNNGQSVYKMNSNGTIVNPPQWLSQTGAFSNLNTLEVSQGFIPYSVNTPLWSDGAEKYRWVAIPNDGSHNSPEEEVNFSELGEWDFPNGTVFIKHFELQTDETNPNSMKRLETRFLVRADDGSFYVMTYKWLPDGSDAELLPGSFEEDITITTAGGGSRIQKWYYPSRSDCFICHTDAAKRVLGLKTRQLNGDHTYPQTGNTANQLESWNHIGIFNPTLVESNIPGYLTSKALTDTSATIEFRARSYLDANCAGCHRPGAGGRAEFDLRLTTPLGSQGIINEPVYEDLGIAGAAVIVPGDTSKSIMYQRMRTTDPCCTMPPIGRSLTDELALSIVGEWIMEMDTVGPPVLGDTITVCASGCDFTNITTAIAAADPEAVIHILEPLHTEAAIIVDKNLTIMGQGVDNTTVQAAASQANAVDAVFEVNPGLTVIFKDLTIQNGNAKASGASSKDDGGGVYITCNSASNAAFQRVNFINNRADDDDGGAVFIFGDNGTVSFTDCLFSGNEANTTDDLADGGAIQNAGADNFTVTRCTFSGNSAGDDGGAIAVFEPGSVNRLINSTFYDNIAGLGGADANGGAILIGNAASLELINCTVVNNIIAAGGTFRRGGGVFTTSTGNFEIINSIIANNTGAASAGEGDDVYTTGGTMSIQTSIIEDCDNCGASPTYTNDPDLSSVVQCGNQAYFIPQEGSDAIDNGTNPGGLIPIEDICGNPRESLVDIGSHEIYCDPTAGCNRFPIAMATANPDSGDVPLTVSFDGSASSDPDNDTLSYEWNFGDSTPGTETGVSVSHTYTEIGTFSAILTVYDGRGGNHQDTVEIIVADTIPPNNPPTAVATASPQSGDVPLDVNFDASGSSDPDSDPLLYSWDFGDNTSDTGAIVSHTYTEVGVFTATLTIDDGRGGIDQTTLEIGVADTVLCAGDSTVYLSDISWSYMENRFRDVQLDQSYDYNTLTINGKTYAKGLGAHAYSNIVYQINGQYDRFKSEVGVDDETCTNGQVVFKVMADGVLIFDSGIMTQADDAVSIDVDIQGVNELTLIVEDGGNNIWCDHADWGDARIEISCDTIVVNHSPIAAFTATPDSGEAPLLVSFDATSSSDPDGDPLTYSWDFGDGTQGSGVTTTHTYTVAGNYTATLTVDDGNGGTHQSNISIEVTDPPSPNQDPIAAFTATPETGEAPLLVSFDATSSSDPDGDPLTYSWDFGDGTQGSGLTTTHTYTVAGNYTATLTVDDGNGGTHQSNISIEATDPPTPNQDPIAAFTATPETGDAPLLVSFDATSSSDPDGDPLTYSWGLW